MALFIYNAMVESHRINLLIDNGTIVALDQSAIEPQPNLCGTDRKHQPEAPLRAFDWAVASAHNDQRERSQRALHAAIECASTAGITSTLEVVDATEYAIFPGLVNAHTHAAMTLLRSFANDMPLDQWLNQAIWPAEAHLKPEDIYEATLEACHEMLASGTTCFNDMYFHLPEMVAAVEASGMRAVVGESFVDVNLSDKTSVRQRAKELQPFIDRHSSEHIKFALTPHAPYTVGRDNLKWAADYARDHNMLLHIHLSETQKELHDIEALHGCSPTALLHRTGVLAPNLIAAHALYLSDEDINLLAAHKVSVVHNPCSNLLLGSGFMFRYPELRAAKVNVALGTDGCASSNNLDMTDSIKTFAMLQKGIHLDPSVISAEEALSCATKGGAKALHFNSGSIEVGKLADLFFASLHNRSFQPLYNPTASLVYSAHADAVHATMIGGRFLYRKHSSTLPLLHP